jgi:hypothetical protein
MDIYSVSKSLLGYQAATIKIKRSQPSAAPTGFVPDLIAVDLQPTFFPHGQALWSQ